MAHIIRLRITAQLKDSQLVSRILDFKEDLSRELLTGEYGTVTDPESIDRALPPVTITIPRKRHYEHMTTFMERALANHAVGHAVQITAEHT